MSDVAPLYSAVVKRRAHSTGSTFGEKFSQFLAREGTTLTAFARKVGVPQSSLHGWVKEGRRLPSSSLALIARASGIPADYWTNDALPWPPAVEYTGLVEEIVRNLGAWPLDALREFAEIAKSPADRDRTLALRRAARQPHGPEGS